MKYILTIAMLCSLILVGCNGEKEPATTETTEETVEQAKTMEEARDDAQKTITKDNVESEADKILKEIEADTE